MRVFFKIMLTIVLVVLSAMAALQGVTKIYNFASSTPFYGDTIYNPYADIDSTTWANGFRKANFHAHSLWDTNGDYTETEFFDYYKASGYDIINLAEHQYINQGETPTYEHGWGLNNYHLLMLGATKVDWLDNPFMMLPKHQMQYTIERLKKQVKLLSINHPERLRHIDPSIVASLSGFDLLEMNPSGDCSPWDSLLSAGCYMPLIASDDAHSITNRGSWAQRCYTMIYPENGDILRALKRGASYGVVVPVTLNEQGAHKNFATFKNISLQGDSISVVTSEKTDSILFVGQNGVVKSSVSATDSAYYAFQKGDTYIRVEAFIPSGLILRSNPFARSPMVVPLPAINIPLTIVNSVLWGILALLILAFIPMLYHKKKRPLGFEHFRWGAGA